MKVYAVIQKYHDNGKVEARIRVIECDRFPTSAIYEEHETFDKYIDYFETSEDAEAFKADALNA